MSDCFMACYSALLYGYKPLQESRHRCLIMISNFYGLITAPMGRLHCLRR